MYGFSQVSNIIIILTNEYLDFKLNSDLFESLKG